MKIPLGKKSFSYLIRTSAVCVVFGSKVTCGWKAVVVGRCYFPQASSLTSRELGLCRVSLYA